MDERRGRKGAMKLYNGKCEELLKQLPDQSIDAVITDPPYGKLAFNEWDKIIDYDVVCKELKRICKPKAAIILFSDYKEMFNLHKKMTDNKLKYRYFFTWIKPNCFTGCANSNRMPLINTEFILVFSPTSKAPNYYVDGEEYVNKIKFINAVNFKESAEKKELVHYDIKQMIALLKQGKAIPNVTFTTRKSLMITGSNYCKISMQSVLNNIDDFEITDDSIIRKIVSHKNVSKMFIEMPSESKPTRLHPTEKPVDLMKKLVTLYSKEGDTVLDFTMR